MLPLDSLVLGDRFRVLGHLGGGGMGEVYLAEQVSLGRKVALKVLKRDVGAQPGMSERFRREARLLSSVDHPAVVRVIDFGQSEDATCLVMELAEGETLLEALRDGPLDADRGRRILIQLSEGLAAIHDRGIIHRDLKPENVVLTRGVRGEQARLLDFGIARLVEPDPDGRGLSQVGIVLGTPEYLSPEQAMGMPLDARSDLYSLGVLAYRMLSGQLPFEGPTSRDYLVQHIHTAPRPLGEVAPPVAPLPWVSVAVMKCLAKEPKARPATARELASLLEPPPPPRKVVVRSFEQGKGLAAARLEPGLGRSVSELIFVRRADDRTQPLAEVPPADSAERLAERALQRRRLWRIGALASAVLLAATGTLFALHGRRGALDRARAQIEAGRPEQALVTLAGADHGSHPPEEIPALRGAAQHALREHDEELVSLRLGRGSEEIFDPLVLRGLCEDLARAAGEGPRKDFLDGLDRTRSAAVLRMIASSGTSEAAWGALRYLDAEQRTGGLDLTAAYAAFLESTDCTARALAARRLSEIGSTEALPALQRARKRRVPARCGQEEVLAALRALDVRAFQ